MERCRDAAIPPKNFKQQQIVIRGCLFEHIKKIKNKVFQNAHGKAMAYKFKGIRQGLNNRNLTLSHWLHLDEKAEVVKK